LIQVVKNAKLIKKFKFSINKHGHSLKTNIKKHNFTCDTGYHSLFFTFFIVGVNLNSNWLPCPQYGLELGMVAMCTIWTWTRVGYHVHNVNLNLGWLLCAQNIDYPIAYSPWKFHNDKQMFFILFNSLTSKEGKMHHLTYLGMKLF
jgi:hypothetical protein